LQSHSPEEELAEGEDPSTNSRDIAERWVSIYTELTEMEDDVIRAVKDRLTRMSPEARRETERTNLPALEEDSTRFHKRLGFWRQRLAQL
jgi:hypothetical protein